MTHKKATIFVFITLVLSVTSQILLKKQLLTVGLIPINLKNILRFYFKIFLIPGVILSLFFVFLAGLRTWLDGCVEKITARFGLSFYEFNFFGDSSLECILFLRAFAVVSAYRVTTPCLGLLLIEKGF